MRFTEEQLAKAKIWLQSAVDHAVVSFWASGGDDRSSDRHAAKMVEAIREAAAALGYSFEHLPVTSQPGFDGRDDRSLGMKEADIA